MTTDPMKRLYRRLRDNVTRGVAGDVMQMPPSWGELLTAVHEAAFPDGDEEPEPITVPEPVTDDTDDDTTTVTSSSDREAVEAAAFAAGTKAQREADHRFLVSRGTRWAAWLLDGRPLVTGDTNTVTSGIEVEKRMEYAKGWGDGYAEGHAVGYRDAALRFSADTKPE